MPGPEMPFSQPSVASLRRRDVLTRLNTETHEAIRSVMPSAVSILTLEPEQNTQTGKIGQKPRGIGAGFVIAPGIIATNRHVIEDVNRHPHDSITIETSEIGKDGQLREKKMFTSAEVVYASDIYDVAFVAIDSREHPDVYMPPVPLGSTKDLHAGTTIITIGAPYALEDTVARGIIANEGYTTEETEFGRNPYMQVDASIRPGNSGGMAINPSLDPSPIIGVPTIQAAGDPSAGFIIPIEVFIEEFKSFQRQLQKAA